MFYTAILTQFSIREILAISLSHKNVKFNITYLGISNNFGTMQRIRGFSYLHYVQNLTILECQDCSWMNDDGILDIANSCPLLESLNIRRCVNVQGMTLHLLIQRCVEMKTLVLRRTSVREEPMLIPTWSETKITELDISHCYYLDDSAVYKIVFDLALQLEYLCCAVTDELVLALMNMKLPLQILELRRRHPVNIDNIGTMLSNCPDIEALDASLTPIDNELFERILPNITNLRWLSLAGHEVLKTCKTLKLISKYCENIEHLGINYYHATCDKHLRDTLLNFMVSCPHLKKVCLQGIYIDDIIESIKDIQQKDARYSWTTAKFCEPNEFKLPQTHLCVNKFANWFVEQSSVVK